MIAIKVSATPPAGCRERAEYLSNMWLQQVQKGGGTASVRADEDIARCTLDVIGASGFQVQFR
jgi:hypothetical protein